MCCVELELELKATALAKHEFLLVCPKQRPRDLWQALQDPANLFFSLKWPSVHTDVKGLQFAAGKSYKVYKVTIPSAFVKAFEKKLALRNADWRKFATAKLGLWCGRHGPPQLPAVSVLPALGANQVAYRHTDSAGEQHRKRLTGDALDPGLALDPKKSYRLSVRPDATAWQGLNLTEPQHWFAFDAVSRAALGLHRHASSTRLTTPRPSAEVGKAMEDNITLASRGTDLFYIPCVVVPPVAG